MLEKILVIFLFTMLLSSCAAKYIPPSNLDNTAKINLEIDNVSERGFISSLYIKKNYSNKSCIRDGEVISFINEGNPFVGSTNNPKNVPFLISKRTHFCIEMKPVLEDHRRVCQNVFSFEPKASNIYKVIATWGRRWNADKLYYSESCMVKVFNLTTKMFVYHEEELL